MEIRRVVPDLQPNKRYIVKVRGTNKLGVSSEWSESIVIDTNSDLSTEEPEIVLTPAVQTIILQWTAVTDEDLDHYTIHVTDQEGFTASVANTYSSPKTGSLTSITRYYDEGTEEWKTLSPGGTYYVQMYWVDGDDVATQVGEETSVQTKYSTLGMNAVETIAADAITTGSLTAGVLLSGSISTGTSGARLVMDSGGLVGYGQDGVSKNLEYDNVTGNVNVVGDIVANAFTAVAGVNQILDPVFDVDLSHWTIVDSTVVFDPDETRSADGSGSAYVTTNSSDDQVMYIDVDVIAGDIWSGSLYAKVDSGAVSHVFFAVEFYDEDEVSVPIEYPQSSVLGLAYLSGETDWVEAVPSTFFSSSHSVVVPDGAVTMRVLISTLGSGSIWIDEVEVHKEPTMTGARFLGHTMVRMYSYANPTEMPGGIIGHVVVNGDYETSGGTTLDLITPAIIGDFPGLINPFQKGRLYKIEFSAKYAEVNSGSGRFFLRIKSGDAGTLRTRGISAPASTTDGTNPERVNIDTYAYYSPESDIIDTITVEIQRTSGSSGTITVAGPMYLVISDVGSYPFQLLE